MKTQLLAGVIAGVCAAASVAQGAVIAQWDFTSSLTAASSVDPNATASPLARGASTNAPITTNDFYASKPVLTISRSNDTASQVYLDATVTAAPGYELNLDSFTFDAAAGGGTSGQRTYEVHSSVAGLARDADISPAPPTSLASGGFTTIRGPSGGLGGMQSINADLSSPAYDHLSTLTMRVYFFTPTTNQNIDLDNLTFNGSVVPVPEPSAVAAGLSVLAGFAGRHRRRRHARAS